MNGNKGYRLYRLEEGAEHTFPAPQRHGVLTKGAQKLEDVNPDELEEGWKGAVLGGLGLAGAAGLALAGAPVLGTGALVKLAGATGLSLAKAKLALAGIGAAAAGTAGVLGGHAAGEVATAGLEGAKQGTFSGTKRNAEVKSMGKTNRKAMGLDKPEQWRIDRETRTGPYGGGYGSSYGHGGGYRRSHRGYERMMDSKQESWIDVPLMEQLANFKK